MAAKLHPIVPGAWLIAMGQANAILLDGGAEMVLIDAGFPGHADAVFGTLRALGRSPGDLRHLVFTHGHPDHIGSAAAIVQATGAATWMHPADAPLARTGGPFRPMAPAPGLLHGLLFRMVWRPQDRMAPFGIDHDIADGQVLPLAGGLRAWHVPGHCAGQVALIWQDSRLLIAGDVGMNIVGLADPVGFEDEAAGRASQRLLAGLSCDAAVFGHGRPIRSGAAARLRGAWAG